MAQKGGVITVIDRGHLNELRRIPLANVIPWAFPGARLSAERQGPGRVRWILPDGTKVNVLPLADGDVFRFMNRPDWTSPGIFLKGAINFLMLARHCSLREAASFLDDSQRFLNVPREGASGAVTMARTVLRHPRRLSDPEQEWVQIQRYLVGQRQLPELMVADMYRRGHVYAGGGVYRGYLVFPHRAEVMSPTITGYSLRWAKKDLPPHDKPTRWVAPGSRLKAGWFSIGRGTDAVVITESAIDALTMWASAIEEGLAHRVTIRSTAGAGGLIQRLWEGFPQVMVATDRDEAGDSYAQWVESHHTTAGSVIRVTPPAPHKDWNEAWQGGERRLLADTPLWEREVARIWEIGGR